MKDPRQAALIRPISDGVAALTQKYGGLLWGEHGKGLRSEYSPAYFGPLYPSLQAIKAAFDPFNQLNPGKIATPSSVSEATLTKVDEVVLRGELDRQIDERVWQSYHTAAHCNGNGACYNFDPNDAMCPSWKATRNRIHSPKGRASLVREWLRLQGAQGVDLLGNVAQRFTVGNLLTRVRNTVGKQLGEKDFSHEVYEARLPGVQVLRGPVPGEGQRAGLPLALPRAVPPPLPAPAEGLCGRFAGIQHSVHRPLPTVVQRNDERPAGEVPA